MNFKFLKNDVLSGFIVFLIALPLCLGIAQASQAPLFSGIVAGVVGGVVIGLLSQSQLSVSGPAAGLVAIVIAGISDLGAFELFLCAVVVAGALQLILGLLKAGGFATYFPLNVIEGMLAGIGLTIIIKQIPDAIGFLAETNNVGMVDAEDGLHHWADFSHIKHVTETGAIIISIVGIAILVLWSKFVKGKMKMIPAALIVVIVGTLLNLLFTSVYPAWAMTESHLVRLDVPSSFKDFFGQFMLPDFAGFTNPKVYTTGIVIAIVASIETLLCIEATDKLDPQKRSTSGNVELRAQGIGNIVSGFLGGLPITSVIVRSSANINAGAKSKMSAVYHGVFLLLCVALIPMILNLIPKAALAAILIFTGYNLCRPAIFKHMWKDGMSQFIPFLATVLGVVFLDLLKGVGIGAVLSILFMLITAFKSNNQFTFSQKWKRFIATLKQPFVWNQKDGNKVLELNEQLYFLNKTKVKNVLKDIPFHDSITIDASKSKHIEADVITALKQFILTDAKHKKIKVETVGFDPKFKIKNTIINN